MKDVIYSANYSLVDVGRSHVNCRRKVSKCRRNIMSSKSGLGQCARVNVACILIFKRKVCTKSADAARAKAYSAF